MKRKLLKRKHWGLKEMTLEQKEKMRMGLDLCFAFVLARQGEDYVVWQGQDWHLKAEEVAAVALDLEAVSSWARRQVLRRSSSAACSVLAFAVRCWYSA